MKMIRCSGLLCWNEVKRSELAQRSSCIELIGFEVLGGENLHSKRSGGKGLVQGHRRLYIPRRSYPRVFPIIQIGLWNLRQLWWDYPEMESQNINHHRPSSPQDDDRCTPHSQTLRVDRRRLKCWSWRFIVSERQRLSTANIEARSDFQLHLFASSLKYLQYSKAIRYHRACK